MQFFFEIGIIIGLVATVSILMKLLKQPLIIGYIITGLIIGPYAFDIIKSPEVLQVFSELGIAFLLFIVGLNLSPNVIKKVGGISFITGIGQIFFTSIIGYFLSRILGLNPITSLYTAIGLTLSSTIIVLKLLSDTHSLDTLHGRIVIGFLIFQDIIAAIVIIFAASFSNSSSFSINKILLSILETVLFTGIIVYIAKIFLSKLSSFLAKSQELLFVFSIGWGLGLASLFYAFHLSLEVGALVAGISLAITPYRHEISARLRPLRDFFLILFFVALGSQVSISNLSGITLPIIIFSLFVLIGNPIIVMIIMGSLGYKKRTSFLMGTSIAQVSEFSLVLVALGVKNGQLSPEILSLMTVVGLITIGISSYFIVYANKLYIIFSPIIGIFEMKKTKIESEEEIDYDVILFGCNRVGWDFLKEFRKNNINVLVIDFDPNIVDKLKKENIFCKYGDAGDIELLNSLKLKDIKMAVSTIPDIDVNIVLVNKIRKVNKDSIIVLTADQISDAFLLYDIGADYVIMPHFLGASYASEMAVKHGFSKENFKYEKRKHLDYLKEKIFLGHEHPNINTLR